MPLARTLLILYFFCFGGQGRGGGVRGEKGGVLSICMEIEAGCGVAHRCWEGVYGQGRLNVFFRGWDSVANARKIETFVQRGRAKILRFGHMIYKRRLNDPTCWLLRRGLACLGSTLSVLGSTRAGPWLSQWVHQIELVIPCIVLTNLCARDGEKKTGEGGRERERERETKKRKKESKEWKSKIKREREKNIKKERKREGKVRKWDDKEIREYTVSCMVPSSKSVFFSKFPLGTQQQRHGPQSSLSEHRVWVRGCPSTVSMLALWKD